MFWVVSNALYCSGNDVHSESSSKSVAAAPNQKKLNGNKNNPAKCKDTIMKSTKYCSIPDGDSILRQISNYIKQNSLQCDNISLPFPTEWPVKDQGRIRFFCFFSNFLNTGNNMKELYVSNHSVVVQQDEHNSLTLSICKSESRDLGKIATKHPDLKDEIFSNATSLMFRYVFNNNREELVVNEIRKSYQMWLLCNPFKRDYIKLYCSDFITWLLNENAGVTIDNTNDRPKYLAEDDFKPD